MNLYLVRHGQSEGNAVHKHQHPDIPLSEKGKDQARLIAGRLKSKKIDFIYASPFKRAKQTAEIISKELKLPVEYWEHLRERKRPSELIGLSIDNPIAVEINKKIGDNFDNSDFKFSDDETFNDLEKRSTEVINHLISNHLNQNVLCVSHGGFIKMIVANLIFSDKLASGMFWQFYFHSMIANTGITHLEYSDKYGWTLNTWNDITHL